MVRQQHNPLLNSRKGKDFTLKYKTINYSEKGNVI